MDTISMSDNHLITQALLAIIAGMGAIMLYMTKNFYTYMVHIFEIHEERITNLEKYTGIERRKECLIRKAKG